MICKTAIKLVPNYAGLVRNSFAAKRVGVSMRTSLLCDLQTLPLQDLAQNSQYGKDTNEDTC